MNTVDVLSIVGIVVLVILLAVAVPALVAYFMVVLFALPFWPSFGLAFFVGMLVRSHNIQPKK